MSTTTRAYCSNCGLDYPTGASGGASSGKGRCAACYRFWQRVGLDNKARRMEPVLLAWEAGELSEGQAARLLEMDRVVLRSWRQEFLGRAAALWAQRDPRGQATQRAAGGEP